MAEWKLQSSSYQCWVFSSYQSLLFFPIFVLFWALINSIFQSEIVHSMYQDLRNLVAVQNEPLSRLEDSTEKAAMVETYSRIGLLQSYGNLQSYWTTTALIIRIQTSPCSSCTSPVSLVTRRGSGGFGFWSFYWPWDWCTFMGENSQYFWTRDTRRVKKFHTRFECSFPSITLVSSVVFPSFPLVLSVVLDNAIAHQSTLRSPVNSTVDK